MDFSSYLTYKITAALGGLAGGATILAFIKPRTIGEAFARGGTSTGTAIIFAGPVLEWFGRESHWELQLVSGFCIGFVAYSLLGAIARFLHKHRESDIAEIVFDARTKVFKDPCTPPANTVKSPEKGNDRA